MDIAKLAALSLHALDPETAHTVSINALKLGQAFGLGTATPPLDATLLTQWSYEGGNLILANPLGLAAGYDKNAEVPQAMLGLGFGFVECGTVTPLAQAGNAKPRLFRLSEDQAVINRMGFNNQGHEVCLVRLARLKDSGHKGIVGINIGANKNTDDKVLDYIAGLKAFWGLGSYFTINISSPNTPGLRALQGLDALNDLLSRMAQTRKALCDATGANQPIALKIAPDLDESEIIDIVDCAIKHGLDGLIVSNTTLERPQSLKSEFADEQGGLSGAPAFEIATRALSLVALHNQGRLFLMAAGGIDGPEAAIAKLKAGAMALQLYSALVYHGTGLIGRIIDGLRTQIKSEGFDDFQTYVKAQNKSI